MTCNEGETRFYLIDPVLRDKAYDEHWKFLFPPNQVGVT